MCVLLLYQFLVIIELYALCKGGYFNIHILTWFIVVVVFNVPSTAKVIWRGGQGLKSHPTGVVRLFHLLYTGNQVLFLIW